MGKAVRSTLGGIALALALALAVPLLVPGSYFIPEVTRFASERLAQPVEMEDLTLHLLPTPRVIGHRISVGRNGEILIGELEIVPELQSLIVGPRSLRLVRASRVAFDESAFAIQRGIPKRRDDPVPLRRLVLNTVKFNHPKVDVPIFNVDLKLGERLRVREARFETTDGTMTLVVRPHGDGTAAVQLHVHVTARKLDLQVGRDAGRGRCVPAVRSQRAVVDEAETFVALGQRIADEFRRKRALGIADEPLQRLLADEAADITFRILQEGGVDFLDEVAA